MTEQIRTTVFTNGCTVISRPLPHAASVAVGLWLLNGSRHEQRSQQGYAHLLEHLFFKSAGPYDARAIARMTDRWGSQVNAFTGRELTALHGWVPSNRMGELTELLITMVTDTRFSAADLEAEQGVILQEMAGQSDAPDEAVETRAVELACGDHPLGRDILGTAETVSAATVETLQLYRRGLLTGQRLAVVAVGAVDHDALVARCAPLERLPAGKRPATVAPILQGGERSERQQTEQAHLVWVMPAPAAGARTLPAAAIGNYLLGDGVSSRLFQEVRERLGLVYDIRSALETFSDCGLWIIQTACRPRDYDRCRHAIEQCLELLLDHGPSAEEMADARDHIASALALEQDTLEHYMERLAREHFYLGRHPDLEERLAQVAAVTPTEVQAALTEAWRQRLHLVWRP